MSILSRAIALLTFPANRRLAAAWEGAAKPSHALAPSAVAPFSGGQQGPSRAPLVDWSRGDTAPSPRTFAFTPGYSDHTYTNWSAPQGFEGFGLERIRNAVTLHRLGNFYESSAMVVALLGFAPVLAALQQAIAQILSSPRHIHGGDRGLARMVASEVESMLVPQGGLLPSPYLTPQTWGTMAIYLRMLGFCVLQHVDGDPDPVTGVRERYTRIWEPWAVRFQRSPRKWLAVTTEGEIEITNDGKFTLVIDENEGHFTGAVVCLGDEVLAGKITQEARNGFLDFFGKPKLVATLPEKIQTHGDAGDAFASCVETIYGPDGRGVLPYGSTLTAVAMPGGTGASQFREALYDAVTMIAMVLIGSDGTLSKGDTYTAPGLFAVRHDLIARPLACMVRGINGGHIAPYCDTNYGDQIVAAKRAGTWRYPVLGVDLPDPAMVARRASVVAAEKARCEILDARKASGIETSQGDADKIAEDLALRPVKLAAPKPTGEPIYSWEVEAKIFAPDEVRARKGEAPLPDGMGSVARLAEERAEGKDKIGPAGGSDDGRSHEAGQGAGSREPAAA